MFSFTSLTLPYPSPLHPHPADSTTALRLMHTLRSLAEGGRTIVTSIHQPSSRLYRQMDKVLRGGKQGGANGG